MMSSRWVYGIHFLRHLERQGFNAKRIIEVVERPDRWEEEYREFCEEEFQDMHPYRQRTA